MRSIGRVEAPRWLSDESLKAAGARTSEPIEIFWGNPMPGTANGREPTSIQNNSSLSQGLSGSRVGTLGSVSGAGENQWKRGLLCDKSLQGADKVIALAGSVGADGHPR
jgi:hypothetical protein